MNQRKLYTLLKREYWEHRGAMKWTPIWIGASILAIMLLGWITGQSTMIRIDGADHLVEGGLKMLENNATPEQLRAGTAAMLYGTGAIFSVAMFFVLFFYCLGALYDDRRDRSVLFWRSLPVSDLETVLSKLAMVLVVIPLVYFAAIIAFHLVMLLVAGLLIAFQGGSPNKLLWGPVEPFSYWGRLLVALGLQALWLLPLYGWLLLVSAWARSKPFLWAVMVPVVLSILEAWVNLTASLRLGFRFGDLLLSRITTGFAPMSFHADVGNQEINIGGSPGDAFNTEWGQLMERAVSLNLWIGVLIGAAMIAAAIWLRRYRDDSATE